MAFALEVFVIVMLAFMVMIAAKQNVLRENIMISLQIIVLQVALLEPMKINFHVHASLVILLAPNVEMNH